MGCDWGDSNLAFGILTSRGMHLAQREDVNY